MVEALFTDAVATLGGRGGAVAYESVAARYEGRPYHNLRHVERTLETYLFLAEGLGPQDEARVVLSLVFHDAVYDPRAGDNEAASAALARRTLAPLGIEEGDLAEIERLILVTRDHVARDPLGALVVDADLAVLQSAPEEYDDYAAAIRREYAFVPDAEYRAGRVRVLEGLMARKLFASPLLDEAAARGNMAREIEGLR